MRTIYAECSLHATKQEYVNTCAPRKVNCKIVVAPGLALGWRLEKCIFLPFSVMFYAVLYPARPPPLISVSDKYISICHKSRVFK